MADLDATFPRGQCRIGLSTIISVTRVLVATDSHFLSRTVEAALADDDMEIIRVASGTEVRAAVQAHIPDVVICDLQITNMGGVAACLDLRMEAEMQRLPQTRILLLLDREADIYLAQQAKADGWLVKPLDSIRLQQALSPLTKEISISESGH
ncbi:MAG: response regulator [Acidimicrobiia bacterium]|nr:response regulator [Acidimicrobiia bacterium]MYC58255.1 response regulator [Acidimicrobiia bacterium]MYI30987.1 response regulator [Acidimicrobiia bacterium]